MSALPEFSTVSPAVAVFNRKLFVAWIGTNDRRQLNIMSSTDGLNFGNKFILGESSHFRPALTSAFTGPDESNGKLFRAWTGTEKTLQASSTAAPALAYVNPLEIDFGLFGQEYAAWIDPFQLNADALAVIA
jgi:hypothetical protein